MEERDNENCPFFNTFSRHTFLSMPHIILPVNALQMWGEQLNHNLNEDTSRLKAVVKWVVDVVVVISIAWFTIFAFGTQIPIAGQSMTPLLESENVVLMNRLSFLLRKPERFDVVAFEKEDKKLNVKRIIGLPGETVQVKNGTLYIDEQKIEHGDGLDTVSLAGLAENPILLKEDEYFLLGDNRDNSEDSRFANVGNINRRQIKGKIWLRISPVFKFGLIGS